MSSEQARKSTKMHAFFVNVDMAVSLEIGRSVVDGSIEKVRSINKVAPRLQQVYRVSQKLGHHLFFFLLLCISEKKHATEIRNTSF